MDQSSLERGHRGVCKNMSTVPYRALVLTRETNGNPMADYISVAGPSSREDKRNRPQKRGLPLQKSPTHPQDFPHPLDVLTEIRTLEGGKGMWYVAMYNNAQTITELITNAKANLLLHVPKKTFFKECAIIKKIVTINLNEKVIVSIFFLDIHFC